FATVAPPDRIAWLTPGDSQTSGIAFEAIAGDTSSEQPRTVNIAPVVPQPRGQAEVLDRAVQVGRTTQFFADGLKNAGYQAELDNSGRNMPRILTGTGGDKIAIVLSSCTSLGCDYSELLSQWTGVTQTQAGAVLKVYGADEKYA